MRQPLRIFSGKTNEISKQNGTDTLNKEIKILTENWSVMWLLIITGYDWQKVIKTITKKWIKNYLGYKKVMTSYNDSVYT